MADFADFVASLEKEVQNEVVEPVAPPTAVSPPEKTLTHTKSVGSSGSDAVKLHLLLVSTHINQTTGYAKVTHGLLRELSKYSEWLKVTHYAIQGMGIDITKRTYPPGVDVVDVIRIEKDLPKHGGFGVHELPAAIQQLRPNIVMIYNDLGVICKYIDEIRKQIVGRRFKLWAYLDQVYTCQPPDMIDSLNRDVDRVFCFTKEWRNVLKSQGVNRPVDVMTHAFESSVFKPMPQHIARENVKLPSSAFIYLSMNRNQPRKRLDILVMAFVDLIVKYPTKELYLMCICDKGDRGGYQLFDIFGRELQLRGASIDAFGGRLLVISKDMCYSDDEINIFYNLADCGVSAAEGEGFGLCAFEQMGLGIPQVLSNVVGHREYCEHEKNSILVTPSVRAYLPLGFSSVGGDIQLLDYRDLAKAMEPYMLDNNLKKHHGKAAREKVLEYTWDKVTKVFIKRLQTAYNEIVEGDEDD
jgi:glycosyltransferase involved in cell wall biosynthesis